MHDEEVGRRFLGFGVAFASFALFAACGDIEVKPQGDTFADVTVVTSPSGTSSSDSTTAPIEAGPPASIHGTVMSFEVPIANAVVTASGVTTMTDANGSFALPGSGGDAGAYDVTVTVGQNVTAYHGLTTLAPVLVAFGASGPIPQTPRHAASFHGSVTGGPLVPYTDAPRVSVSGIDFIQANVEADAKGVFTADDIPTWLGTDSAVAGTVHASIVTADGNAYYGSASADFAQATATAPASIALASIGTAMTLIIDASGADPAKTTLRAGIFFVSNGGGYALTQSNVPLPIEVQRRFPNVAGASVYAELATDSAAARVTLPIASTVAVPIALPLPPSVTVSGTTFTVDSASSFARVTLTPDTVGPTVTIIGPPGILASPEVLPKNAPYHWRAFVYGPAITDSVLPAILDVADGALPPLLSQAQIAVSAPAALTTPP